MRVQGVSRCLLTGALGILLSALPLHAQEEEDIRPPRPPVEIPKAETVSLTPWIVAASLLTAGILLGWWLRRGKEHRREIAALDRAMAELGAIDRERNQLDAGPLADRSADAVRRFIASRFGIAAPSRTTEEFLRTLTSGPPAALASHRDLLREFLHTCDMAKFAGLEFDAAERLALLQSAFRFVQAAGPPDAPSPDKKEAA